MMMLKNETRLPAAPPEHSTRSLQRNLPAAPHAALHQAHALGTLLGQSLARNCGNSAASAAVLPLALRPRTAAELIELQFAVAGRLQQLQQGWMQGWNVWLGGFGNLKRATTMSEHLEQQYNLVEQFTALLKAQAADLMDLQENVEVDYGYWVTQKLQGA